MSEKIKFKAWLKKEKKMVDVMGIPTNNKKVFWYIDKERNGLVVFYPFEDAEFMQCVELKDETNDEQYVYEKVEYDVMCEAYEKWNKYNHSLLKIKKILT